MPQTPKTLVLNPKTTYPNVATYHPLRPIICALAIPRSPLRPRVGVVTSKS